MNYLRQFVILFFIISISYGQDIRINEVSSSNSMFYDEDGDTPDWIELYNPGADEVLLNNWSLSDVENDNNPWTFPDITLDADEYLLIWASDKDRSNINFIRTLINEGDSFKFIIPDENTPLEWINNGFDDSSWNSCIRSCWACWGNSCRSLSVIDSFCVFAILLKILKPSGAF